MSNGFGKVYLVLDRNQAGWLYCLLTELMNKSNDGSPVAWSEHDTLAAKTIAAIIEAGDSNGQVIPSTGSNPIWLSSFRHQRLVGHSDHG